MCNRQAIIAVQPLGAAAPLVYSFAASYARHPYPRLANADDPADVVVDVSAYLEQKQAAALCHVTQNPLFVRRRSETAGRPMTVREVLLTEEAFRRQWPAEPLPTDPFLDWVRSPSSAGDVIDLAPSHKHGLSLSSPVMNAAGMLGFAHEYRGCLISATWAPSSPTRSPPSRARPPTRPMPWPLPSGLLIHTGLPNPGLRQALRRWDKEWGAWVCR